MIMFAMGFDIACVFSVDFPIQFWKLSDSLVFLFLSYYYISLFT